MGVRPEIPQKRGLIPAQILKNLQLPNVDFPNPWGKPIGISEDLVVKCDLNETAKEI